MRFSDESVKSEKTANSSITIRTAIGLAFLLLVLISNAYAWLPPVPDLEVNPEYAKVGDDVSLDGSSSYVIDPAAGQIDPCGINGRGIVRFEWNIDGTIYYEEAGHAEDGNADGILVKQFSQDHAYDVKMRVKSAHYEYWSDWEDCTADFYVGSTDYNFVDINESNTSYNAYACDVNVFPFDGNPANLNSMVEAADTQYYNISADDTLRWTTADPGFNDEIFLWVEMQINEHPSIIGRIDLVFDGNTGDSGDINHKIYVMKADSDWTQDSSWVQVGSDQNIPAGTDTTMVRTITSDIEKYIDGDGKIVWGVYEAASSEVMHIDYLEAAVYTNDNPVAPTGLAATSGHNLVNLSWDENSDVDLAGYNVYRSTTSGAGYTKVNQTLVSNPAYTDNSAVNGTTYYYVVTAVDTSSNESKYSNEVEATPVDTIPAAPAGLWAIGAKNTVYLDWNDSDECDIEGYNVYRSNISGSDYVLLNSSFLSCSDYSDVAVDVNTTYYYVVRVVDMALNESETSDEVSAAPDNNIPTIIYSFEDVNSSDSNFNAYACDVDVFPFLDKAENRNSMVEAGDAEYLAISADDTSRWITVNPSVGDEMLMWVEMKIDEPSNFIGRIDLKFVGCTEGTGNVTHKIYVKKLGEDWTKNDSWQQIGSEQSIPAGVDTEMVRSITSDISSYIDETGKITWVVYEQTSERKMHVNYLGMVIYTLAGDVIYVDADAAPGGNGLSWTTSYKYLQDALDAAQSGQQIWVADGTYYPDEDSYGLHTNNDRSETFQLAEGVEIYGSFAGNETSLDQRNLKDNETILSGDIDGDDSGWIPGVGNCYHVVTCENESLIDGFSISGGVADGPDGYGGGGILSDEVTGVKIQNCDFYCNNSADTHNGGGFYNNNSTATLINCLFNCNTAAKWNAVSHEVDYGYGGAIYNDGNLSLINCTLSDNLAGDGGGIYTSSGLLTVENSILWANENATYTSDLDGDGKIDLDQIRIVSGTTQVTNSCIQDDDPGELPIPFDGVVNCNIDSPPQFLSPGSWKGIMLPGSISVQATIRDFDGYYTQDNQPKNPPGHTDFQRVNYGPEYGIVLSNLGEDGLPQWNSAHIAISVHGEEEFNQWYRDVEGINLSATKTLVLFPTGAPNEYQFLDDTFYPIDNELLDKDTGSIDYNDSGTPCSGCGSAPLTYHNYHFTCHLKSKFYYDGTEQNLKVYKADDDLWIFIDGRLVVDLGGVHGPYSKYLKIVDGDIEIYADSAFNDLINTIQLGLDEANEYSFDLFFAERHTNWSHLEFTTTLKFDPNFIQGDYHLQSSSPCIDAGDNLTVPVDVNTDLDGWPRFIDDPNTEPNGTAIVDMGAYEYQVPIAADDEYSTAKNEELVVPAPGVLENDQYLSGCTLEAIFVSSPSHGLLTDVNSDGSFTYEPNTGYVGTDTFTYKTISIVDEHKSATATVTISIIEHMPVAEAGTDQNLTVCYAGDSALVILDGSGSTGNGGNIASYEWTWTENGQPQTASGEVAEVLISADGGSPYDVNLTVTNSSGGADTDTVRISIDVQGDPAANAGDNLVVKDGGLLDSDEAADGAANVTLNGSGSAGIGLTYIWYAQGREIGRESTPVVRLGIGTHIIGLLVIDDCGKMDYAESTVTVHRPFVGAEIDAGEPQDVWLPFGEAQQLHGIDNEIFDPNNEITNYEWRLIEAPGGGYVLWPDGKTILEPNVILTDGITGEYKFLLIGRNSSLEEVDRDSTSITVHSSPASNTGPVVSAWISVGGDKLMEHTTDANEVTLGGKITDDGQLLGELTSEWILLSGPVDGIKITPLEQSCTNHCTSMTVNAAAKFTQEGTYKLLLRGSDGTLSNQNNNNNVVVVNYESQLPPFVYAGENHFAALDPCLAYVDVYMSDAYVIDRDFPFNNTTPQWTLISEESTSADINFVNPVTGEVDDINAMHLEKPAIRFYEQGKYRFELSATDANAGAGEPDRVWVTIREEPVEEPNTCTALYAAVSNKNPPNSGDVYRRIDTASSWVKITADVNGPVTTLCEYDGSIYAGTMEGEASKVMKWSQENMTWQDVSVDQFYNFSEYINCGIGGVSGLAVYNGNLYASTLRPLLFRYDDTGSSTWTLIWNVPTWGDWGNWEVFCGGCGIAIIYPWNGHLYLGQDFYDVIDRHSDVYGAENVLDTQGDSCIWDFEVYHNKLYASAWGGKIYDSNTGEDWSGITPPFYHYDHLWDIWSMEVFQDKLYIGPGGYLWNYDGNDFTQVMIDGQHWQAEDGEILSMVAVNESLFIGTGYKAISSYGDEYKDSGRVYRLWIDNQQETHIENFSQGQGIDPNAVKGVQCLISAPAIPEPSYLQMEVAAYAEDLNAPGGWADANSICVSPEYFDADEIKYEITIDPNGQTDANELMLTVLLPVDVDFVYADDCGAYDEDSRSVIWLLDDISEEREVIYQTDFSGGLPTTGWTIVHDGSSQEDTWRSDNPAGRSSYCWTGTFMIADGYYADYGVALDEKLIKQSIDCTGLTNIKLSFNHSFYVYGIGDVDVSINGGAWQNAARYQEASYEGPVEIDLSSFGADNASDVRICWHYYTPTDLGYWGIDDVSITATATTDSIVRTLIVKVNDDSAPGQNISTVYGLRSDSYQLIRNDDTPYVCCWDSGILYVDAKNTGVQNGRSWKTAFKDVSIALNYAAISECYSEIWVTSGSYILDDFTADESFIVPDGISIYGGFEGDERDRSERSLLGIEHTLISGNNFADYVVTLHGTVTIDGFTIMRGQKAGIKCENASAQITHCLIGLNGSVAGIYLDGASYAEITNCIIADNSDAGIYLSAGSSAFIRNNTIARNWSYGVKNEGSLLTIYNCILWQNGGESQSAGCDEEHCYTGTESPFDGDFYFLRSDATGCIDQGLNEEQGGAWSISIDETDVLGKARIVGRTVDIGADEFPPIRVDAGDTIYEKIPVGDSSVRVDFGSASVMSNGEVNVPTNLSYQWNCIYHEGSSSPEFVAGTDSQLYAGVVFEEAGWYRFNLRVMDADDNNKLVGTDILYVHIETGVEIVLEGKTPVMVTKDAVVYEAWVDETVNLNANFGPPTPVPPLRWWEPYMRVTIENPDQAATTITFDDPGLRQLTLYAYNAFGEITGQDVVWINVSYPMAEVSAGPDRILYLEDVNGVCQVSETFNGSVSINADRVEWSVEAADDDADLRSVSVDPNILNPYAANITFGHYGNYFVLFKAWKNTSQGEVFLGTGAALTTVTYKQVRVSAGTYPPVSVENAPATLNLHGEIIQGQVDSVEWVFPDTQAPEGLVTFANPYSLNTMVFFNAVDGYSGTGEYPITLLGKINVDGNDVIADADTTIIIIDVNNGSGDDFTKTICITTEHDGITTSELPLTTRVYATIKDCQTSTSFEEYDYAVWSWGGTDNSVMIDQADQGVPEADVIFYKLGTYTLNLIVKNQGEILDVQSHNITIGERNCSVSATAGFDADLNQKVRDVEIGEEADLYGSINVSGDCEDTETAYYWLIGGPSGGADLSQVNTELPNVQAGVIFNQPGEYPITLCVVDAKTGERLASETIHASVAEPPFWLRISGLCIGNTSDGLNLTASILGGAPDGSTCTWSTDDTDVNLPDPATVPSGTPVTFDFNSPGTYVLTVTGNVSDPNWSQTGTVTVYVSESISLEYNAGSTQYINLPKLAHMSDAVFVTNVPNYVPKWSVVSGPNDAEVIFMPDDNAEKPSVFFSKGGQYKLSLVPWDLQTQAQVLGTNASEVYVFVDMPIVPNPDSPAVTLSLSDGPSDNLKILTATANDKDGISQLWLKLNDELLAITSGSPAYNQKLTLNYTLDLSHLPFGTSYIRAYALDTTGSKGQSNDIVCENNYSIRDFKVSPATINSYTGDYLTFAASFDDERDWTLYINNLNGSFSADPYTGEDDSNLQDGLGPIDTNGWPNGNYSAILTVTDTCDTGEVRFTILRDQILPDDVIADLYSFEGELSGYIPLFDEAILNNAMTGTDDFMLSTPIIKDGQGRLFAKLGNASFPDDVKYKLQICDNQYNVIQIIAPSDVPHDAGGWAKTKQPGDSNGIVVADLGIFDFSMLENGTYYMELSVWCNGTTENDYVPFILDCPLKIGNLKFSQEDLVVETGGIPLHVVRTYDSFRKHEDGEFGHGWSYSIANLDLELDETRIPMCKTDLSWDIDCSWPISTRYGGDLTNRNVTLTLPDGRRTTFMFYLAYHGENWGNSQFPYYTAEYLPAPGIDAELYAVAGRSNIAWWDDGQPKEVCRANFFANELYWEGVVGGSGAYDGFSITDGSTYDFYSYILKTEDGTEYHFEREQLNGDYEGVAGYLCPPGGDGILDAFCTIVRGPLCLTRIRTADGSEINLNTSLETGQIGLEGNIECLDAQGNITKSLEIVYANGRISYINAPSEVNQTPGSGTPTLIYEYDEENGNLIRVKKLVNKNGTSEDEQYDITEYVYSDDTHESDEHYITAITDERGLTPIRYVYDAAGRLVETIDAKGNSIVIQHGTEASNGDKAEVVCERWDTQQHYPTVYAYNARGNVTLIQKNEVDNSVPLEETKYTYDSYYKDAPSKVEQWLGGSNYAATEYDYDIYGRTLLSVDPCSNAIIITGYDECGNVLGTIQAKNYIDGQNYDTISITSNIYQGSKLKSTEIRDAADTTTLSMTVNIYDGLNRLLNVVQVDVDKAVNFDNFRTLQDINQLSSLGEDPTDHPVTTYCYAGNSLQPEWIEDPAGARTYFAYDDNGRQKYSYYRWENPADAQDFAYVFNVSTYDDQGRVIETKRVTDIDADPAGGVEVILSRTEYNSIGKVDYSISDSNNLTRYFYDQLGNVVETCTYNIAGIDWDDKPAVKNYIDEPANVLTVSRTIYDTEGRAFLNVGPYAPAVYNEDVSQWPVGTETVYDVLGRVVETRRWAAVEAELVPFKVLNGQPVPCQLNDAALAGKMVSPIAEPQNAWDGSGTAPDNIGWTANGGLLPITGEQTQGELSYSRTIYDIGGRVYKTYTQNDAGEEICTSEYVYDAAGRQIQVISLPGTADETITETHYDGTRRDYVTDANNNTTYFEYDALGRVTATTYPEADLDHDGNLDDLSYSYVGYDGLGRKSWQSAQTRQTDRDHIDISSEDNDYKLRKRQFEYDAAGRLRATVLPEVDDPAGGRINPRYEYDYDVYGNLLEIRDAIENRDTSGIRKTTFTYNELHQQTSRTLPEGQVEEDFYDEFGRIWKHIAFDKTTGGDGINPHITIYEYNSKGQLEHKTHYDEEADYDSDNPTYNANPDIWYQYDSLGRKSIVTATKYDAFGGVVEQEQWSYYYDAEGRIEIEKSPQGYLCYSYSSITGQKAETRTYLPSTALEDVQSRQDDDITRIAYFYDETGRLAETSVLKRDGISLSAPEVTTYDSYDDNGNREQMTLDNSTVTSYSYDPLNRLTDLVHEHSTQGMLSTFGYKLGADGTRKVLTEAVKDEQGTTKYHKITYGYDELNRIETENADETNSDWTTGTGKGYSASYVYDIVGNRKQRIIVVDGGASVQTDYTYNSNDQLIYEDHSTPGAALPYNGDNVYAYAGSGGITYRLPGSTKDIGRFQAWLMGLPSGISHWLFGLVMSLLVVAFFIPAFVHILARIRGRQPTRMPLSLSHRCLSVLLAYVMLISPAGFEQAARASLDYSGIAASDWATSGDSVEYAYDDSGRQITKNTTGSQTEYVTYEYNNLDRLTNITTTRGDTVEEVGYRYNPDGIRVESRFTRTIDGVIDQSRDTVYLVDSYNHTGYSQIIEEEVVTTEYDEYGEVESVSTKTTTYTIGDDIVSQYNAVDDTQHLLYDGHGSTRQLADYDAVNVIVDSYGYDAYGVMLGGNPTASSPAGTNLLYAGEHFDSDLQKYYLRARWYDQSNGLFNRMDDFGGNNSDPQSLHKYLYCHANPVNGIDPLGLAIIDESGGYPYNWTTGIRVHAIFYVLMSLKGGFYDTPVGNIIQGDLIGAGLSLLRPDGVIRKGSKKGFYELKPITNIGNSGIASRVKAQMRLYDLAFSNSNIRRGDSDKLLGIFNGQPIGFVRYNGYWYMVKFYAANRGSLSSAGTWKGLIYYSLTKINYEPPKGGKNLMRPIAVPETVKEDIRIPQLAPITLTIADYKIGNAVIASCMYVTTGLGLALMLESLKPCF